jgi:hypothetical protein
LAVDLVFLTEIVVIVALVVLLVSVMRRYRRVQGKVEESLDIGEELSSALEQRLRKQDERIIDMMARLDVLQSRSLQADIPSEAAAINAASETSQAASQSVVTPEPPVLNVPSVIKEKDLPPAPQLDTTERTVLQLLLDRPRTSVEIKSLVNKSREHTARLMKSLFERFLVERDDSKKPYVYRITEKGRRYFSET